MTQRDAHIMREGPPENLPCYTCVYDGNYRAKKRWYPCMYCAHLPLQPTPPRSGNYYQRMPVRARAKQKGGGNG